MVPVLSVPFIRKAKLFLEVPADFPHLADTHKGSSPSSQGEAGKGLVCANKQCLLLKDSEESSLEKKSNSNDKSLI